jgi:hypothetical protein
MHKMTAALACVIGVFSGQTSLASTPIHFIYAKTGATYEQFQSARDDCAKEAKRHFLQNLGLNYYLWRPSSTAFLKCMVDRGYTLDNALGPKGWDTGVLWTL